MSPSLPHLPQEIKDIIFDNIHRHEEFATLARTCRQLYIDVNDLLYNRITWTWDCDRCEPDINSQPQLLLRTILARPDLANKIQHIDLRALNYNRPKCPPLRPCDTPILDPSTLEIASIIIQSMSLHNSAWEDNWISSLWSGSLTATLALAISQLHNLHSLSVSLSIIKQDHYLEAMLAHAAAAPTSTALSSFASLHSIALVPSPASLADHRPWLTPRAPDASIPLLRFPTLHSARLLLPAIPFGTLSRQRHAPQLSTSGLQTLALTRTSEKWPREPLVLAQCPRLRTLHYERYAPVQTAVDLGSLSEGLMKLRDSQLGAKGLETLCVRVRPYYPDGEMKPRDFVGGNRFTPLDPAALRGLESLRVLEASALVLGGWDADRRLQLAEVLPCGLEKLVLWDDCWSLEEAGWWEDVCLVKIKALLTGVVPVERGEEMVEVGWREIVPRLREVELCVRNMGESWARKRLRDVCKQEGIRCTTTTHDEYDYRMEYAGCG